MSCGQALGSARDADQCVSFDSPFIMVSVRNWQASKGGNMSNRHLKTKTVSLHFVEASEQIRAKVVAVAQSVGCHCQPYADLSELAAHPPRAGIIIIRDDIAYGSISEALDRLLNLGIWLPVVAIDYEPSTSRVVQAVKGGALDYLTLPLKPMRLAASISRIMQDADCAGERRMLALAARRRLSALSAREMQVLNAIAFGGSNKDIARSLEISPRTVETHRAKLMAKLCASHVAEAVRIKLDAHMEL